MESAHADLPALTAVRSRAMAIHADIQPVCRSHLSVPAAYPLPHHLALGAFHDVVAARDLRHPLSRLRPGTYPADALRRALQASVGMGDARLPTDFPSPGLGAEALAAVDTVLRLGTCHDLADRHRSQRRSRSAETAD